MVYSYTYTSADRVAIYGKIGTDAIPDSVAEDGEGQVDTELKKAGISPSGITVTHELRMAATFYICWLLAKSDRIKIRGPEIASESGGGVNVSYASVDKKHDWYTMANKFMEDYFDLYTTEQPLTVKAVRKNVEQRGWEEEEYTQYDRV